MTPIYISGPISAVADNFSSRPPLTAILGLFIFAEFTEAPYCVSETGWGEFEIGITIHLRDSAAEPLSLVHKLKLYPSAGVMEAHKPVVDEHYDEVVFNAVPTDEAVARAIAGGPTRDAAAYPYQEYFGSFSPDDDLAKLQAARQFLQDRKLELQDRLLRAQAEADREREEVRVMAL